MPTTRHGIANNAVRISSSVLKARRAEVSNFIAVSSHMKCVHPAGGPAGRTSRVVSVGCSCSPLSRLANGRITHGRGVAVRHDMAERGFSLIHVLDCQRDYECE